MLFCGGPCIHMCAFKAGAWQDVTKTRCRTLAEMVSAALVPQTQSPRWYIFDSTVVFGGLAISQASVWCRFSLSWPPTDLLYMHQGSCSQTPQLSFLVCRVGHVPFFASAIGRRAMRAVIGCTMSDRNIAMSFCVFVASGTAVKWVQRTHA